MRYAGIMLIVLLACSAPADALELVWVDPQAQKDAELLWLLTNENPVPREWTAGRGRQPVRLRFDRFEIRHQVRRFNQRQIEVLERLEAMMPVHLDSSQLKPTITSLQKAFTESDTQLLESVWDVGKARFVEVRNGKLVAEHSLTGKASGRVERLSRLVRAERLADWLKLARSAVATADHQHVLVHLRSETRGKVIESTSLHLRRIGDSWKVLALVHGLRGC